MKTELKPIGVIHSPYKAKEEVPIQASRSDEEFHESDGYELSVKPFLDNEPRGVFATRAPGRPNPIGLSIVGLIEIRKNVLKVRGIDVIDGTPLLDIKPYVPEFDQREGVKIGWLKEKLRK